MSISIEESTTDSISPVLEAIVNRVKSLNKTPDSIQKDYLLALLIASMIENGFVTMDDNHEILDWKSINGEQVSKWKSQTGVYEVPFIMTGFKEIGIKLILSPLGAVAVVNVIIIDFEAETYSVCLPMSKYVVAPQATTTPKIFRDLKHFSMTFKDKVLAAVKSRILDHYGYASASLIGLPEELFFKIMLYLPVNDVIKVSRLCMRTKGLLETDSFWHYKLERDFKSKMSKEELPSPEQYYWKNLYQIAYMVQKEKDLERRGLVRSAHSFMDADLFFM